MRNILVPVVVLVIISAIAGCKKPSSGRGGVEGTVVQATTGEPIQGVHVKYANINILTDEDGRYVLDTIPEGLQGFTFYSSGYKTQVCSLSVPRDGMAVCNVELEVISVGWAVGGQEVEYGTIFYTSDAGGNWKRQGTIREIPDVELYGVCAVDTNTCWVVGDAYLGKCTILKTTDAGNTWQSQLETLEGGRALSFGAIAAMDADTAWAVSNTAGVVIKTKNKGVNWSICYEGDDVARFEEVATPDGINIWCVGQGTDREPVVKYSPDGGLTWSTQSVSGVSSADETIFDIKAITPTTAYLAGSQSIGGQKSDDAGVTWRQVNPFIQGNTNSVCAIGNKVWFAGDYGSIFYSYDGFATSGAKAEVPASYLNNAFSSISMIGDGTSGAVTMVSMQEGGTGGILCTDDGGRTWKDVYSIPYKVEMHSISFAGETH